MIMKSICVALVATLSACSIVAQPRHQKKRPRGPDPCRSHNIAQKSTVEQILKEKTRPPSELNLKSAHLLINERQVGDVIILDLVGDMEGLENLNLRFAIDCELQKRHKKIILNLKDVKEMDEVGMYEVNVSGLMVMRESGKLKLLNLTTGIKDLLKITKLLTIFDVYDNETEAVDSFP